MCTTVQIKMASRELEHLLPRVMVAESDDGLLFSTVQVYSPPVVTVRVCVYCAISESTSTVSVPSVTVAVESLVQVTVVAGPPVEIQVRVSWSESNNITSSPIIFMSPVVYTYIRIPIGITLNY